MKYKVELIGHVDQTADKSQMGVLIDKKIINKIDDVSKLIGWGGKRRIIETALNRFIDELRNEEIN